MENEIVEGFSKGMTAIALMNFTLLIPTNTGGCVCQCKKHRLEAKQQAREAFSGLALTKLQNTDVRNGSTNPENQKKVLRFEEVFQGEHVCMYCIHSYLLLLPNFRGEEISELFLQRQYPL